MVTALIHSCYKSQYNMKDNSKERKKERKLTLDFELCYEIVLIYLDDKYWNSITPVKSINSLGSYPVLAAPQIYLQELRVARADQTRLLTNSVLPLRFWSEWRPYRVPWTERWALFPWESDQTPPSSPRRTRRSAQTRSCPACLFDPSTKRWNFTGWSCLHKHPTNITQLISPT